MGMFDAPQYLTGGDNGLVQEGEEFMLLNARLDGQVTIAGDTRDQVKLAIPRAEDTEQVLCWTSGRAIVNQVKRMERGDLPKRVRLDTMPSGKGNPTFVLTPADQPPASGGTGAGEVF